MDSNHTKRRSFKSKLIRSFYLAATKPSSAALQPYGGGKPSKPSPSSFSPASAEFIANQPIKPKAPISSTTAGSPVGFVIVNQDQVFPQQTPKVAFVVADSNRESYGKLENFYGGGAAEDEGVDDRAAKYISSVQERFRLERVNSERKNLEDICV